MSNDKPLRVSTVPSKPPTGATRPAPGGDQPTRPGAQTPKWDYWRLIKSASPWKLAALSLGIEPASIDANDPKTFPSAAAFGRFNLITAAITQRFSPADPRPVALPDFIHWAASISLDLPPELRALGETRAGGSGRDR